MALHKDNRERNALVKISCRLPPHATLELLVMNQALRSVNAA